MRRILPIICTLIFSAFSIAGAKAGIAASKSYQIEADYADVLQDVENGITDAGHKIDVRGKISKMLTRTGKDLGLAEKASKASEFIQFCSADLSREMKEADATNPTGCPYIVFAYETISKPGIVNVGYIRPVGAKGIGAQKVLGKIDALLDAIVKEAVGQ